MTILGSSYKSINESLDTGKGISIDKKQSLVGAEFQSTRGQIKKNELTGNNMIDCSIRVGDPIQTEFKTQYESMVDEVSQNNYIVHKYDLFIDSPGLNILKVCDVIKKLEIDIFNLRGQLELSRELNEVNEKIIKVQREEVEAFKEYINKR